MRGVALAFYPVHGLNSVLTVKTFFCLKANLVFSRLLKILRVQIGVEAILVIEMIRSPVPGDQPSSHELPGTQVCGP